jgi:hypothetical protein
MATPGVERTTPPRDTPRYDAASLDVRSTQRGTTVPERERSSVMTNEKKDSGLLFRTREKRSERAPDYHGRISIGGTEYELAGWRHVDRRGDAYLSLSARLPREQRPQAHGEAHEDDGF